MRRSLALLQESYYESQSDESDTEENTQNPKITSKDKPQATLVSYPIKDLDSDNEESLSDHQNDSSDNRMLLPECFGITFSIDDIPLPPDNPSKDPIQAKVLQAEVVVRENKVIDFEVAKLSDYEGNASYEENKLSPLASGEEPSSLTLGKEPSSLVPGKEPSSLVPGKEPSSLVPGKELSPLVSGKELSPLASGKELSPLASGKGLSPLGSGKELSPLGSGKELSPLGSGKELSPLGSGKELSPLGSGKELSPLGSGKELSPLGLGKEPSPLGLGKEPSPLGLGKEPSPLGSGKEPSPLGSGKEPSPLGSGKEPSPLGSGKEPSPLGSGKELSLLGSVGSGKEPSPFGSGKEPSPLGSGKEPSPLGSGKEPSPLSPGTFEDMHQPELISDTAGVDDKEQDFKNSKSLPDPQDNPPSNQIEVSKAPSLPTDDSLKETLLSDFMSLAKESDDDIVSGSERSKFSQDDDFSDIRVDISEISLPPMDYNYKDKLQFELTSACGEGVDDGSDEDDEMSSLEDSKQYNHQDYVDVIYNLADLKQHEYQVDKISLMDSKYHDYQSEHINLEYSKQYDHQDDDRMNSPMDLKHDYQDDGMNYQEDLKQHNQSDDDENEMIISEDSKPHTHQDRSAGNKMKESSLLPPVLFDEKLLKKRKIKLVSSIQKKMLQLFTNLCSEIRFICYKATMSSESRSQTALASLHETYTDSEGEIESDAEEETIKEKYISPSKESTPSSMDDTSKDKPTSKLVSYATEEGMDDDEMSDSEDSKSSSDHQDDSSDSKVYVSEVPPVSPVSFHRRLQNLSKSEIQLPPEPKGRCSKSLQVCISQEKISELYEKRKAGKDMNASIQKRKDFRNPSIYEKLIQFCNIDEQGTNYPPEIYDPHCWGPESYYEELAKRQKEEMDKREKEKKERTKVEFISGTAKKTGSESTTEGAKRKSKWDIGINQMPAAALKPAALITPTVLPVPTGTKPTVISAFGTISKKAKQ